MPKEKLSQYRGTLSPTQIVGGMNAAIRNVGRLADDARILFGLERYPTAALIPALSIDESGKVTILRHFATARDLRNCGRIGQDYIRRHPAPSRPAQTAASSGMSDGTPFLRVAADRIGAPGSPAKMPFRATNAANWCSIIRIGAKMAVIRR